MNFQRPHKYNCLKCLFIYLIYGELKVLVIKKISLKPCKTKFVYRNNLKFILAMQSIQPISQNNEMCNLEILNSEFLEM